MADSEALTELVRLELGYGMDEKTGERKAKGTDTVTRLKAKL